MDKKHVVCFWWCCSCWFRARKTANRKCIYVSVSVSLWMWQFSNLMSFFFLVVSIVLFSHIDVTWLNVCHHNLFFFLKFLHISTVKYVSMYRHFVWIYSIQVERVLQLQRKCVHFVHIIKLIYHFYYPTVNLCLFGARFVLIYTLITVSLFLWQGVILRWRLSETTCLQ